MLIKALASVRGKNNESGGNDLTAGSNWWQGGDLAGL